MNTIQSLPDSIIIEIHTIREVLAKQYQNDLIAYSHATQEHCRNLGFHTVESPRNQNSLEETPIEVSSSQINHH